MENATDKLSELIKNRREFRFVIGTDRSLSNETREGLIKAEEKLTLEIESLQLKKQFEMACHNLSCYSANAAMTIPKQLWITEWNNAKDEVNRLQKQINLEKPKGWDIIDTDHEEIAEETVTHYTKED